MRHNIKWRCFTHRTSCESEEDFHEHLQEEHQRPQQILSKPDLRLISDYSKQPSLDFMINYRESDFEIDWIRTTRSPDEQVHEIEESLDYWSHVLTKLALISQLDLEEGDAYSSLSASVSDYQSLSLVSFGEVEEAGAEEDTTGEMLLFKNLESLPVQDSGIGRIDKWIEGVNHASSSGDSDDRTAQMLL